MNKIVLAQINTVAGCIEENTKKIMDCIEKAKDINADLVVFPKFVLTGFPFGDILKRHVSIFKRQENALEKIIQSTKDITALISYADLNEENQIVIAKNGNIINDYSFEINGETFGLGFSAKLETLIKPACDESRLGSEFRRNQMYSALAKGSASNLIYINKVGYGDNLVFDGASRIYDKNGNLIVRAKSFDEDFVIVENHKGKIAPIPNKMETKPSEDKFTLDYTNDLDRTYHAIVYAIREYFSKNGFSKAVLGLSGGLDSSVCAVLLADALGQDNVWGISMPSHITSDTSKADAQILAKNLGINFIEIPISSSVENMKSVLNLTFNQILAEKYTQSTTVENLQARLRATILWSVANEHKNMLPIATSDKSEAYIGYATVNGDMSGGFAPIIDVTKTKLFALADYLNKNRAKQNAIPQSVLEKPPGAELKINPKTGKTVFAEEDNMPYEFLDEIIWYVENFGYGVEEFLRHRFMYETKQEISFEQKQEWINKFFWKSQCAVYKWHIIPPSVIIDTYSIINSEYHQPIISKIK